MPSSSPRPRAVAAPFTSHRERLQPSRSTAGARSKTSWPQDRTGTTPDSSLRRHSEDQSTEPGRRNGFIGPSIRPHSHESGSTTSGTLPPPICSIAAFIPGLFRKLLGHSTISLTLDTYSHVAPALHA